MISAYDISPTPHKHLTLYQFQQEIKKQGPQLWNKDGKTPLIYFQLLLMSQQFEFVRFPGPFC